MPTFFTAIPGGVRLLNIYLLLNVYSQAKNYRDKNGRRGLFFVKIFSSVISPHH
jgi:hypothetical protein